MNKNAFCGEGFRLLKWIMNCCFWLKDIQIHWLSKQKQNHKKPLNLKWTSKRNFFSFSPSIELVDEGKWLLAVGSFEAINSLFDIPDENNSFSISTPGHWSSEEGEEFTNKLNRKLKGRSEWDIELHVDEVRKRSHQIKIGDKEYNLSDLDTRKNEIFKEKKHKK